MTSVALVYPGMLAGLLLAGMHAWLGIRIMERRLVFAGLTLAQLAALGSIAAIVAGYDPHGAAGYAASLILTTLGALAIALTPRREGRVSHEAIVAILYVGAAAATAMLASLAPPHASSGNILTASLHSVLYIASLYAVTAVVLYALRKQLTVRRRVWDFVFYAIVGIVVTASVSIAGVLLVFAYLLIPAVIAVALSERPGTQLAIGWVLGATLTAAAILIAFKADLPTGATIAGLFGIGLVIAATAWTWRRKRARSPLAARR